MAILVMCLFMGVIHLVATLSYGVRIAGARTGRVAFCLSLFNLLVLVSRTSNTFLTPALSKRVEAGLAGGATGLRHDFHLLIFAASVATAVGIFLIPMFQRYVTRLVNAFERFPSLPRILQFALSRPGWEAVRDARAIPSTHNLRFLGKRHQLPLWIFVFNVGGTALLTTGVLSSLYAGIYAPEIRMTTGQLSAVVNFLGTLLLFAFVDPYLSFVTDSAVEQCGSADSQLRAAVFGMATGRLAGTVLAHLLFLPGAWLIAWVARIIPA